MSSSRRIAVRLTADALRHVRRGSPWVFDGSIVSPEGGTEPSASAGDLAVIFDDKRRFTAIGLWDPTSPIRLKVLHQGAPRQIDQEFWRERIATAIGRRDSLRDDPDTTGYRCVHGENDGLPGLVIDRYDRTYVVKLYSPIWFPHLADVVDALVAAVAAVADGGDGVERVVVRLARSVAAEGTITDGATVWGPAPDGPILFRERGLTFEADVVGGNKTGHFLDQRDNRALVRAAAAGARVLDVFANTGGFSVSAAAGGAASVHLVDASRGALDAARRNLDHNRHIRAVRECEVRITVGDAFDVLRRERERPNASSRYDVVVIDPPSFASNERSVPSAERAYARLTRAGLDVLAPGGLLVQASCSSRISEESFARIVHDAARRTGVELHEIRRTGHAIDHPIGFEHGAYLKALFARTSG